MMYMNETDIDEYMMIKNSWMNNRWICVENSDEN